MLRVHRQQRGPALFHRRHEQVTGHYQRLFICQQQTLARSRGRHGRGQSRRTDDRRHHDMHIIVGGHQLQGFLASEHFRASMTQLIQARPKALRCRCIGEHRVAGSEALAKLHHGLHCTVGGQGEDAIAVGMARQHVQRARADGAAGPENRHHLPRHAVRTPP